MKTRTLNLRRRTTLALAAGLAVTAAAAFMAMTLPMPAHAQANPNADRPLRVILPVGAGSGVDTIMRAAGPAIGRALGQPVVIENLPGAGGITGTGTLVKAAPDGLTIGVVSNNHVVNPSVFKNVPFDALKDITTISVVGETPFVFVVNPDKVSARTGQQLAAFVKASPGTYNYGSSGNGTIIHLAGEMVVGALGAEVRHIPYKGVGPQLADTVGGQVEMGVFAVPAAIGQIKTGKLRPIGITGKARVASLPDVPTMAEQGFADVDVAGWFAVVAPAGLPADHVKRIHAAVVAGFAEPEVVAMMAKQENIIDPSTPEAARAFFAKELERYAQIVKRAQIKID
jgi:tripartite-type tricarboxylate transporter receptor subunit TctC